MRLPASLVLALAATVASAHPGGLDRYGCHTEKAPGQYHCHERKQLVERPPSGQDEQPANRGSDNFRYGNYPTLSCSECDCPRAFHAPAGSTSASSGAH